MTTVVNRNRSINIDSWSLIVLLLTTLLPSTPGFNIFKFAIVALLIIITKTYKLRSDNLNSAKIILSFWFASIIIASAGVWICEKTINFSRLYHELSRLAYYSIVILLCMRLKISLRLLFYCCIAIISLHLFIQLSQYFRTGIFDDFILNFYLLGDRENLHFHQAIIKEYMFRSGSIFINPNVYVCYPCLSLAVFYEYHFRTHSRLAIIFVILSLISVVLTGSRMGIIIFVVISCWYLFFLKRNKRLSLSTRKKIVLSALVLSAILILTLVELNTNFITSRFRSFDFRDAYYISWVLKFQALSAYLTYAPPLYFATGSIASYLMDIQIDMELGYIFAWFGIIGLIWYGLLVRTIYKNQHNDFTILSTIVAISILLTAFGATSIINMSVFPFIAAISLTNK